MPRPEPTQLYDYLTPSEELPDEEELLAEPQTLWKKVAEFRGAVAGGHVNNQGEVSITIKVPREDKYLAMPVTDIAGVLMVFSVYKPEQDDTEPGNLDSVWNGE